MTRTRRTRTAGLLATVALLTAGAGLAHADGKAPRPADGARLAAADPAAGRVLVAFADGADASRRAATLHAVGGTVAPSSTGAIAVTKVPGLTASAAAARLAAQPGVRWATPDVSFHVASAVPDDRYFEWQWGLRNHGQLAASFATPGADIGASNAWDVTTGDPAVTIAVVDTGIAYDHPDLRANIAAGGHDFIDGDDDPRDLNGHGSEVAGVIGASGNNGIGVAGVAWRVGLLPLRACDANGQCPADAVLAAFRYAIARHVRIVNASIVFDGAVSPALQQAFADVFASAPDTLFIVPAGNGGGDVDQAHALPCTVPAANVVCVGATDAHDRLASWSGRGASVDVAAPGASTLSTLPRFTAPFADDLESGGSAWVTGASGASPWVLAGPGASGSSSLHDHDPSTLGASYLPNADAAVRTARPVALAGAGCGVAYSLLIDTEPGYDQLTLEASTSPDGPWTVLDRRSGSSDGAFERRAASLQPYDGAQVYLRFAFRSDGSIEGTGVWIDDVRVWCVAPAASSGDGDYWFYEGTSLAAAHVSGVAALVLSRAGGLSTADLRAAVVDSAARLPSLAGVIAGGRLDARAALDLAGTAPTVASASAASSDAAGEHIAAAVRTGGRATRVSVEYGPTTGYGSRSPEQSLAADGSVGFDLAGLASGATYHYRIVATNAAGASSGADLTFATAAAPAPAAAATATSPASRAAAARPARGLYFTRAGSLLACGATATTACRVARATRVAVAASTLPARPGARAVFRAVGSRSRSVRVAVTRARTASTIRLVAGLPLGRYRVVVLLAGAPRPVRTGYVVVVAHLPAVPAVVTPPTTGTVTTVDQHAATLSGSAGAAGQAWFEYGATAAYGQRTATQSVPAGPVSAALSELAPGTAYHYRLAVQTAAGVLYGSDATFTTSVPGAAAPAPQPAGQPAQCSAACTTAPPASLPTAPPTGALGSPSPPPLS